MRRSFGTRAVRRQGIAVRTNEMQSHQQHSKCPQEKKQSLVLRGIRHTGQDTQMSMRSNDAVELPNSGKLLRLRDMLDRVARDRTIEHLVPKREPANIGEAAEVRFSQFGI